MTKSGKAMGGKANGQHGAKTAGKGDVESFDESDIASLIKGRNSLQGINQGDLSSQRQAVADEKGETDGLIESFEKLDKDVRAERDLGKRRSSSH